MKRVRKAGYVVRYFGVGEYGDKTWRPHYHFALFGYPCCYDPPPRGVSRHGECWCDPCKGMYRLWDKGFSDIRILEHDSAQYICGYVTKKLTRKKTQWEKDRLGDRDPEFAVMSRRPGIGCDAMKQIADDWGNFYFGEVHDDVPSYLNHGKKKLPLGRYLMRKLREFYGYEHVGAQPGWSAKRFMERKIREESWLAGRSPYEAFVQENRHFEDFLKEERLQKVLNVEVKSEIFGKRGEI